MHTLQAYQCRRPGPGAQPTFSSAPLEKPPLPLSSPRLEKQPLSAYLHRQHEPDTSADLGSSYAADRRPNLACPASVASPGTAPRFLFSRLALPAFRCFVIPGLATSLCADPARAWDGLRNLLPPSETRLNNPAASTWRRNARFAFLLIGF